jgi:hypothetical protein
VSGTIHDQLGGTLPRVTLTLTSADNGAKHEIKSTPNGTFEFVGVPAGNYTLTASNVGFKSLDVPMQIAAGQTARRDLTLDVGTLQETITVVDAANGINRATTVSEGMAAWHAPVDASACTAQPNSGGIKPPVKVRDVKPLYPASMAGSDVVGKVSLKAVIGVDGAIQTVDTVEATNTDFAEAAKDAVRQWRFTSTLLNCVPVDVEMNVAILFRPTPPPPPLPPPPPPAPAAPAPPSALRH